MATTQEVLEEFKKNLISFFDELIDLFPREADLILMRIFLKDQIPIKSTMDLFIYRINADDEKLKKMVQSRNESFFLDNDIFAMSDSNIQKSSHFKKLWRSDMMDDEDKIIFWRWIDSFVFLADKYQKTLEVQI